MILKNKNTVLVIIIALVCFLLGLWLGGPANPTSGDTSADAASATKSVWTCSMHPKVQQPEMGQCPLCGMDLIAMSEGGSADGWSLVLSEKGARAASIRVAPVARKWVTKEIRMVGKVAYDEKRVGVVSAWVPGRLDRLYIDFAGVFVKKGDPVAYLYSPDLLAAQQKLIEASQSFRAGTHEDRQMARHDLFAAREKLLQLGSTPVEISEIERRSTPADHLTVFSPMDGVVIEKQGIQGMYVSEGAPIYTIADLSRVWVELDAYEEDLPWLRFGQNVTFETRAHPGVSFAGRVVFIDPLLNPATRTVKVRLMADNKDAILKPDMFVRASLFAKISGSGSAPPKELAGKWVAPLHPEIVKDEAGTCQICGTLLVRAETLDYMNARPRPAEPPLVIPDSAALITGRRAVVYVAVLGKKNTFEGRVVKLGAHAGDEYIVEDGLREGEYVVTHGNFKIDSELQIRAKQSMMYENGEPVQPERNPTNVQTAVTAALSPVLSHYFGIQEQLSQDQLAGTKAEAAALRKALESVDASILDAELLAFWNKTIDKLKPASNSLVLAKDLSTARTVFAPVSDAVYDILNRLGVPADQPVHRFFCPMAFENKGAYWLQDHEAVANPYFGDKMYRCGSKVASFGAKTGSAGDQPND